MVVDALLPATEWDEYRLLARRAIRNAIRGTLVVDGRNALDLALLSSPGFVYVRIGRASATSAQLNDVLDSAGTVEAHAVAD